MTAMTVRRVCPLCGKRSEVVVDKGLYERFERGRQTGEAVTISGAQVLFPDLTAAEREILISGTHGRCFDRAFGGES